MTAKLLFVNTLCEHQESIDPYGCRNSAGDHKIEFTNTSELVAGMVKVTMDTMSDNEIIKEGFRVLQETDSDCFVMGIRDKLNKELDEYICSRIQEDILKYLGEGSDVESHPSKLGNHLLVDHNKTIFSVLVDTSKPLYMQLIEAMPMVLELLGKTKKLSRRADYWEIYCLFNLYEYRSKYEWR